MLCYVRSRDVFSPSATFPVDGEAQRNFTVEILFPENVSIPCVVRLVTFYNNSNKAYKQNRDLFSVTTLYIVLFNIATIIYIELNKYKYLYVDTRYVSSY